MRRALIIPGHEYASLCEPCVYRVVRDGEILYVGASAHGLQRVFGSKHHAIKHLQPTDEVHVQFCSSKREAFEIEKAEIRAKLPKWNKYSK